MSFGTDLIEERRVSTNIRNKAGQVRYTIDANRKHGFEYGEPDVRRIVNKRWPDLLPEIREQIIAAVMN